MYKIMRYDGRQGFLENRESRRKGWHSQRNLESGAVHPCGLCLDIYPYSLRIWSRQCIRSLEDMAARWHTESPESKQFQRLPVHTQISGFAEIVFEMLTRNRAATRQQILSSHMWHLKRTRTCDYHRAVETIAVLIS